jgi:hypothetical protein
MLGSIPCLKSRSRMMIYLGRGSRDHGQGVVGQKLTHCRFPLPPHILPGNVCSFHLLELAQSELASYWANSAYSLMYALGVSKTFMHHFPRGSQGLFGSEWEDPLHNSCKTPRPLILYPIQSLSDSLKLALL